DEGDDLEPPRAEALVVREGVAEVPDAHDHDGPVVGEAELAGDLVEEELDVVADTPGPVGAEVREVFADLRRVHPGQGGEALGRDRADVVVGGLEEGPVVEGQAGDRCLGDSSGGGHFARFPARSVPARGPGTSPGVPRIPPACAIVLKVRPGTRRSGTELAAEDL